MDVTKLIKDSIYSIINYRQPDEVNKEIEIAVQSDLISFDDIFNVIIDRVGTTQRGASICQYIAKIYHLWDKIDDATKEKAMGFLISPEREHRHFIMYLLFKLNKLDLIEEYYPKFECTIGDYLCIGDIAFIIELNNRYDIIKLNICTILDGYFTNNIYGTNVLQYVLNDILMNQDLDNIRTFDLIKLTYITHYGVSANAKESVKLNPAYNQSQALALLSAEAADKLFETIYQRDDFQEIVNRLVIYYPELYAIFKDHICPYDIATSMAVLLKLVNYYSNQFDYKYSESRLFILLNGQSEDITELLDASVLKYINIIYYYLSNTISIDDRSTSIIPLCEDDVLTDFFSEELRPNYYEHSVEDKFNKSYDRLVRKSKEIFDLMENDQRLQDFIQRNQ